MKNILRFDSPVMVFLSHVADLMILSLLWLICSLPIITMGGATTALYYASQEKMLKTGGGVISSFFKAFRREFYQSTALLLIFGVSELILLFISYALWTAMIPAPQVVVLLSLVPPLVVLVAACYGFSMQARFTNTVLQTWKNALLLAIGNPITSVALGALAVIPIAVVLVKTELFLRYTPLWVTLGPGGVALAQTFLMKKVFSILEKRANSAE